MIDLTEVTETVEAYLDRYGTEHTRLAPLLAGIDQRTEITSRSTFTGHLTCSAVLLNPAWQALHIHHNVLGRWLCPGGHLEPGDTILLGAALREVEEETGITAVDLVVLDPHPVDIDVHLIPASPARGEPDHWHFDLRYAFTIADPPELTLQAEEVSGSAWLPVETGILQSKLTVLRTSNAVCACTIAADRADLVSGHDRQRRRSTSCSISRVGHLAARQ